MQWFFLLVCTFAWGIAEIFYKKGNLEREKYSHLKTTALVGIFFGIYAAVITIIYSIQDITFLKYIPINMLIYLPVALCYIISMICSYFGVRFIQESLSDPIENSGAAVIVPILCAIFLHETTTIIGIIGIIIVVIGLVCVSFFDENGKEERTKKLGKRLAILAFAMPFCYALFDSVGTFLDLFYTEYVESTLLKGVTEETLEHMANCCYEFTFFLVSIGILIFFKIKKVKLFSVENDNMDNILLTDSNNVILQNNENLSLVKRMYVHKDKILASLFETIGQATYLFALSEGGGIAAVIIGAGTVIISFILSRVFLKEKLSKLQYIFIAIVFIGIIILSFI